MPEVPEQIGPYKIKKELGRGGFAIVYLASHPTLPRDVAVKIMTDKRWQDEISRKRFQREAEAIAELDHHAIVQVYDYGVYDDGVDDDGNQKIKPYIVMQYMADGTLGNRLRNGSLSLTETCAIVSRLAEALDKAHTKRIIHRDIKPSNVLIKDNLPYLTDFGIAYILEQTGLTKTDGMIGSQPYMAPEQWRAEELGRHTDVYQLGVMLFEILTEQLPFLGPSSVAFMYQHIEAPIPSACAINSDLPSDCDRVLKKAMAKKPSERYATAGELAADLAAICGVIPSDYSLQPSWITVTKIVSVPIILVILLLLGTWNAGYPPYVQTPTPTYTPTITATLIPTKTITSTYTYTPAPSPTNTDTATPTETATDTPTNTSTSSSTHTPSPTPSPTNTPTPTNTPQPTTSTPLPSPTPTTPHPTDPPITQPPQPTPTID